VPTPSTRARRNAEATASPAAAHNGPEKVRVTTTTQNMPASAVSVKRSKSRGMDLVRNMPPGSASSTKATMSGGDMTKIQPDFTEKTATSITKRNSFP